MGEQFSANQVQRAVEICQVCGVELTRILSGFMAILGC